MRFGKLEPYSLNDRAATRSSNTRQLEFAPAGASATAALLAAAAAGSSSNSRQGKAAAATSSNFAAAAAGVDLCSAECIAQPTLLLPLQQQGKCALSDALSSLQDLCCATLAAGKFAHDRSGLLMHTPATFAGLVMGLASRVKLQLADNAATATASAATSSCSDEMQLTRQLPEQWQLPPPFQVAWRAAWQWLLHAVPAAATDTSSSSSAAGHRAAQQQQQQQEATQPLMYSGSMRPSGFDDTPTPVLRLILLTTDALARLQQDNHKLQMLQQLMTNTAAAAAATAIRVFSKVDDALRGVMKVGVEFWSGIAVIDSVAVTLDAQEPDVRPMQVRAAAVAPQGACIGPQHAQLKSRDPALLAFAAQRNSCALWVLVSIFSAVLCALPAAQVSFCHSCCRGPWR
jgi:hypothetical protein